MRMPAPAAIRGTGACSACRIRRRSEVPGTKSRRPPGRRLHVDPAAARPGPRPVEGRSQRFGAVGSPNPGPAVSGRSGTGRADDQAAARLAGCCWSWTRCRACLPRTLSAYLPAPAWQPPAAERRRTAGQAQRRRPPPQGDDAISTMADLGGRLALRCFGIRRRTGGQGRAGRRRRRPPDRYRPATALRRAGTCRRRLPAAGRSPGGDRRST
jgi:hypothetical protein